MQESSLCPCGSGKPYIDCCALYHHSSQAASTPEQLMRSRYCAYVLRDEPYLLATWHPSTRPAALHLEEGRCWLGLKVVGSGEEGDQAGWVEFVARSRLGGRAQRLEERSRFIREAGRWYYVDGVIAAEPAAGGTGRNAPCPCGSGRKYKRCCA